MKIKRYRQLEDKELKEVRQVLKECQEYDQTSREPYLSNQLNFDQTMPAFFLAYDQQVLQGFLAVYADDYEPEISIYVRPEARRKGLARSLYQDYQEATAGFGLQKDYFATESVFVERHPDLMKAWSLLQTEDIELLMERQRQPFSIEKREDIEVCLASQEHVAAIAEVKTQAFGAGEGDERLRYVREALADPNSYLYIAVKDQKVVATCTVDVSTNEDYIFGLAVEEAVRQQGIGSYLVQSVVNDRIKNGQKRAFQLAVDKDNDVARTLYEKLEFKVVTEICYYTA